MAKAVTTRKVRDGAARRIANKATASDYFDKSWRAARAEVERDRQRQQKQKSPR